MSFIWGSCGLSFLAQIVDHPPIEGLWKLMLYRSSQGRGPRQTVSPVETDHRIH